MFWTDEYNLHVVQKIKQSQIQLFEQKFKIIYYFYLYKYGIYILISVIFCLTQDKTKQNLI